MGLDGVDDLFLFLVLPGVLHAQRHMGAFKLVIQRLADIVQQTRALGGMDVGAQLGGHHAGDMGHLNRVLQHVLAIAGAVMETAQQLLQLGMQAADAGLQHGALALGADDGIHLPLGLLHHLLDVGGMDAAVGDELLQCKACHLAAHRLEAGHRDGLGGIVDNEIGAGQRLDGADVAALAADDAALHLVIGQGYHTDGDLGHMVGGAALDGGGHDLAGAGVGLFLGACFDLLDLQGSLVGDLGLHLCDQVLLGLVGGEAGDTLQHLRLAALDELDLLLLTVGSSVLGGQCFFLLLDLLGLMIEILFLLL